MFEVHVSTLWTHLRDLKRGPSWGDRFDPFKLDSIRLAADGTFTASILAILGAAQAGVTGFRKLNDHRNASRRIGDLVSELEIVQSTLKDITLLIDSLCFLNSMMVNTTCMVWICLYGDERKRREEQ